MARTSSGGDASLRAMCVNPVAGMNNALWSLYVKVDAWDTPNQVLWEMQGAWSFHRNGTADEIVFETSDGSVVCGTSIVGNGWMFLQVYRSCAPFKDWENWDILGSYG